MKPLVPTTLSQYVRLNNCDRYLWYRLFPERTSEFLDRFEVTEQPLSALLSESGAGFEEEVVGHLGNAGFGVINLTDAPAKETVDHLRSIQSGQPIALTQASLIGQLGSLPCAGNADLILAERAADGQLAITLSDIKASRKERVEHRLQVAVYVRLLEQMLTEANVPFHPIQGAIIHRDEEGSFPDLSEGLTTFPLGPYLTAVANLVEGDESVVHRILRSGFAELKYHLNYKCDGCMYNGLCMTDSSLRQDLSLIPHLQAVEKRVLQEAGVQTLSDLVALKEWFTSQAPPITLPTAPDKEAVVAALSA